MVIFPIRPSGQSGYQRMLCLLLDHGCILVTSDHSSLEVVYVANMITSWGHPSQWWSVCGYQRLFLLFEVGSLVPSGYSSLWSLVSLQSVSVVISHPDHVAIVQLQLVTNSYPYY